MIMMAHGTGRICSGHDMAWQPHGHGQGHGHGDRAIGLGLGLGLGTETSERADRG